MFCPNINDKIVKQLFEELKDAVGEIAAYDIWNQNQGLPIDRVPDGTDLGRPSKLFSDLLAHFNGDRREAIRLKSVAFSKSFKNSFGDWVNDRISFKPGDIVFGHPGIGKTYSFENGKFKDKFIDWDVEYNEKRDKWIEEHSGTKKGTAEYKKARNEYLIYPENHPDYLDFLGKEWERVKLKAKLENKILFVSPSTLLKLFPNDFNYIINLEYLDFIERGINRGDKDPASWKEGINKVLQSVTGIPTLTLGKGEYLELLLEKLEANSKRLDKNGEPLVEDVIGDTNKPSTNKSNTFYHGTGAFGIDLFSNEFLRTGEGNTAFTSGFYFTGSKAEAEMYRVRAINSKVNELLGRVGLHDYSLSDMVDALNTFSMASKLDALTKEELDTFVLLAEFLSRDTERLKNFIANVKYATESIKSYEELKFKYDRISKEKGIKGLINRIFKTKEKLRKALKKAEYAKSVAGDVLSKYQATLSAEYAAFKELNETIDDLQKSLEKANKLADKVLKVVQGGKNYIVKVKASEYLDVDTTTPSSKALLMLNTMNKQMLEGIQGKAKDIVRSLKDWSIIGEVHGYEALKKIKNDQELTEEEAISIINEMLDEVSSSPVMERIRLLEYLELAKIGRLSLLGVAQRNVTEQIKEIGGYLGAMHYSEFSKTNHYILYNSSDIEIVGEVEKVDSNGEPLMNQLVERYYGEREDQLLNDPKSFDRLNSKQQQYFDDETRNDINDAELQLEESQNTANEYGYGEAETFQKLMDSIRNQLLTKLQSRLKTIDMRDPEEASKLKAAIKYALTNLADNNISTLTNIIQTIAQLQAELHPIAHKVIDSYKGKAPKLSNEYLLSLNRNFFGFYCPLMELILNDLLGLDTYKLEIGAKTYEDMKKSVADCKLLLDNCSNITKKMLIQNTTKLLLKTGLEAKSPTIYNYIQNNTETTTTEISGLVRWLGAGDKINDEAVKSLYKIIQDNEDEINHTVFEKTKHLLSLLKLAGNKQKILFETDINGKPTSFIVRASNYGEFIQTYKKELKNIRAELGIGPNELGLPENRELRIEYNKRRNKWLSENSERRYTKEYYDLFNELSQESTDARDMIQLKIRNITDKVKDQDGFIEFERLTDEEWDQLNSYYIEKNQLASKYDIHGELKEGVELLIAEELSNLNEKLAKGLKMVTNQDKFDVAIANKKKLLSKGDITLKEFDKWINRNTRLVYTEEFYNLLKKIDRTAYGERYDEINEKKKAILNMFRDTKTGEVNPKLIPPTTIRVLNKIDSELRSIRKKTKKVSKEGSLLFEDVARIVPSEQFKIDEREVLSQMLDNPGAAEAFYLQHTLMGPDGRRYPKSYYTKIVPKDKKYIKTEPSMNFTELSEESPYYNRKFRSKNRALALILKYRDPKLKTQLIDEMLDSNKKEQDLYDTLSDKEKDIVAAIEDEGKEEYMQPKLESYNNFDKFLKIFNDPNMFKLRQELVNTLAESNEKMPNLNNMNKYKMPLISGSMYRFMKSNHGVFAGAWNWLKEGTVTKGDDVGIRKTPKYAPDGSSLNFIPQYFIQDLEEPSTINMDLVGGVLRYFLMAESYKKKGDIRASVESIKMFLRGRKYVGYDDSNAETLRSVIGAKTESKEGYETNIYLFVEKFINMNLYDVKTNTMVISVKGREVNISKMLSKFKALGTLRNLGWSLWVSGTGFFTAMHNLFVLTLVGRYYDFNDSVKATKEMAHYLIAHSWRSIGNKNYKSKLMAYMDYFEVGSTVDSMFKATNVPAIVRVFNGHWAFGFYSLVDFFVKGSVLNAVLFNYKNVKGQFICKEDFLNKYGDNARTRAEWNGYKSAYESIEYVNGKVLVKDIRDKEAWDSVKYVIGRTALNLSASADGTLNKLQKALLSANIFGSMVMMHRQYIPLAIQEKWTMDRQWDYTTQRYKEAILKTPVRVISLIYRDLNTLNILLKTLKALQVIIGFKTGITDLATLANLKLLRIEILLVNGIYPILSAMLNRAADEDKKNIMLNLLAYIMLKTLFESFSPYNLVDIFNTIKNPTALFGIMDNFGTIISYPKDLIMNMIYDTKDIDRKITKGAYKGLTPLQKAVIQATPFKNYMELYDLPSKRSYFENQILKQ